MPEVYRIRQGSIRSTTFPNGVRSVNIAPFMRIWPGRPDPIQHEIVSRASNFNYLDINRDFQPSQELHRGKHYEAILNDLWGDNRVYLDLNSSVWIGKDYSSIRASERYYGAIEIICAGKTLGASPSDPLDVGGHGKNVLIWEGYKEENNFWGLFSDYIDDSAEKVQGLYIDPWGSPLVILKDLIMIDNTRITEDFATFFAMMKNIRYLEYR